MYICIYDDDHKVRCIRHRYRVITLHVNASKINNNNKTQPQKRKKLTEQSISNE